MAECICFELPPEMHTTHYGAVEPGSTHEPNPRCRVHFPTNRPPFRMSDGSWSDRVDRRFELSYRDSTMNRWEVFQDSWGDWSAYYFHEDAENYECKEFRTWREAYDYADRMARGAK